MVLPTTGSSTSSPASGARTPSHSSKPAIGPPTAIDASRRGARSAAPRATCAKRASATNTVASQSSTMYPASSPVRCQLTVVRRSPARRAAATVSQNSGRLEHISARPSPALTPRARIARTNRFAFAFASARVRFPASEITAGRSGSSAAQNAASIPRSAASWSCSGSGAFTPGMLAGRVRRVQLRPPTPSPNSESRISGARRVRRTRRGPFRLRPATRTRRRCRRSPRTG